MSILVVPGAIGISLLFAASSCLTGYAVYRYLRSRQSLAWPATTGTIVECNLVQNVDKGSMTHKVDVLYEYSISGVAYRSRRIGFGYGPGGPREEHESLYGKLRGASLVQVFYNPSDPRDSVLAPGVDQSAPILTLFGLTLLVFSTGCAAIIFLFFSQDTALLRELVIMR